MKIFLRELQKAKAPSPMLVTLQGIFIPSSDRHKQNIPSSIEVKLCGSSIHLRFRHKLKGLKNDNPFLQTHRTVIATFMGLGVMLFTNFLIDAPATVKLTNKFIASSDTLKRIKEKEGVDVQV